MPKGEKTDLTEKFISTDEPTRKISRLTNKTYLPGGKPRGYSYKALRTGTRPEKKSPSGGFVRIAPTFMSGAGPQGRQTPLTGKISQHGRTQPVKSPV